MGDILRRAIAVERGQPLVDPLEGGIVPGGIGHRRAHHGRRDDVRANALFAILRRHRLGEAGQPRLHRAIDAAVHPAHDAEGGTDGDDRRPHAHMRQDGPAQAEGRAQRQADHFVQHGVAGVMHRRPHPRAGIVDQMIDPPEPCQCLRHDPVRRIILANVRRDEGKGGVLRQRSRQRRQLVRAAAGAQHGHAIGAQGAHDRRANAACRAGDDRDLLFRHAVILCCSCARAAMSSAATKPKVSAGPIVAPAPG